MFFAEAFGLLSSQGSLSRSRRGRFKVLPKLRTPQVGISLRSLSHNLGFDQSEVEVDWHWHVDMCDPREMRVNFLLYPAPFSIVPTDFKVTSGPLQNMDGGRFGFFTVSFQEKMDLARFEESLVVAEREVGKVHGVIIPECALLPTERDSVRGILANRAVPFVVTGIRDHRKNIAHMSFLQAGSDWSSFDQQKHHRWCIDSNQVHAYHLGSVLHPGRRWWEDIALEDRRKLHVIAANGWLTMCHLICEDLARQDPVAPLIRTIGPNLVICLLLDGPQLSNRWPGQYAGVLTDDPGASVLTLSAYGMVRRSAPPGMTPLSTIALWRDRKNGIREIPLENGSSAVVLSICANWTTEWSADGRSDGDVASELQLAGVHQIRLPS
jgi:hypothetical protein